MMMSRKRSLLFLSALVAAAAIFSSAAGTSSPSSVAATAAEASASIANAVSDEAELLPCTLADVRGEFARLLQTGELQMAALPCEPWVRLSVSDAYGDSPSSLSRAQAAAPGQENDAVAFALSPTEAARLRAAGIASGQAVALNDVVAAVAVGPRTPGFGGSASRLALRLSDTAKAVAAGKSGNQNASQALWVDSRYLDGGRPFPAPQQYKPVPLSPSALKNATSAQAASSAAIAAANPDPNGLFVILTAADPKAALAARRTAREPHLLTAGPDAEATRSSTPASVDTTAPNARLVSGSFGTAPVPVPRQTQRPAVGGLGGEAVASSPQEGYEAGEALLTTGSTLYVTSTSTTDSFLDAGEAAEAGKVPEVWEWSGFPGEAAPESSAEGAERRRLRLRRRLLRDAAGE